MSHPSQALFTLQENIIPASFHDGLLLYIHAVTETLAHGGTVTDGDGITQRMWNRSFQGQGLEVTRMGRLGTPQAGGHEELLVLPHRTCPRPTPVLSSLLQGTTTASLRPSCPPFSRAPSRSPWKCPTPSFLLLKCLSLLLSFHMEWARQPGSRDGDELGGVPELPSTPSKHSHLPPCLQV